MGQLIKKFEDGSFLEYDRGGFDDWCVYYTNATGSRRPPYDIDYFSELKDLTNEYGVDKIYNDYVQIYNATGKEIDESVLDMIDDIASSYAEGLSVNVMFTILYMAMIAEERKENTHLGKRIKRLGIHTLLIDGLSISDAANFMRGMGWREVSRLCEERGF